MNAVAADCDEVDPVIIVAVLRATLDVAPHLAHFIGTIAVQIILGTIHLALNFAVTTVRHHHPMALPRRVVNYF